MRTTPIRGKPLRFAVLRHSNYPGKPDHYDLVFEVAHGEDTEEAALVKFETGSELGAQEIQVTFKGQIRRRYLQYQGPMTGNRGQVQRVDSGTFRLVGWDYIKVNGNMLNGRLYLDTGSPCESVRSMRNVFAMIRGR